MVIRDAKLIKALEDTLRVTKRKSEAVLKETARGLMRHIIDETPPGGRGRGGRGQAAKSSGADRVRRGVGRVLAGVPAKDAEIKGESAIAAAHKAGRNHRAKPPRLRIRAPKSELAAYVRKKIAKVGTVVSGWGKAAVALGVSLPAWIKKHGNKGNFHLKLTATGIRIRIQNAAPGAIKVRVLPKRIEMAVRKQAGAMRRRLESAVKAGVASFGQK